MVGLAVGFAFRDITENFIASILLGTRRPFRIGDYIQVAGQAGVVKSLNTRATVLVTLEGKQIRIPNHIIYKEILVNSSASPTSQGTFDVLIPYEASTTAAIAAITQAISDQEGVLRDPPPRVLVEAMETNGIRLRAYYWVPVEGVDGLKLLSDLRLKSKVGAPAGRHRAAADGRAGLDRGPRSGGASRGQRPVPTGGGPPTSGGRHARTGRRQHADG